MGIVSDSFKHGLPHEATTIDGAAVVQTIGRIWYVDAGQAVGSNGSGTSWKTAFATMAEAFAVLASGDVIFVSGYVREQLVTPVNVFDVRVIGIGPRPRHADATPVGGNQATASWGAPASGAVSGQATVRVLQQGWEFNNILFTMQGSTAAGVELCRDAGAGDLERDASHAVIRNCRFAGAGVGVRSGVAGVFTEIVFNALVEHNVFQDNTTAISGINGNQWKIQHNIFRGCTNAISVTGATGFDISYNTFGKITTGVILLTSGSDNGVHYNSLPGTYTTGANYAEGSSDNWNGNAASTGFTAAVP